MNALIPFLLLLTSCASSAVYRSPGEYHGGGILGRGTYLQEVIVEPARGESFRYQAVFQRRATGVMITGLTGTGASAFRIKDSLRPKGEPQLEILVPELQARRERLAFIHHGFRALLLLGEDQPARPSELVKERYHDRRPRVLKHGGPELLIEEYDWDGHAFRLSLSGPDFKAKITLREYTPE